MYLEGLRSKGKPALKGPALLPEFEGKYQHEVRRVLFGSGAGVRF